MWFSEKALVFVDTRSAALAVYRKTLRGSRLIRFGVERFESRASQAALFSDVIADSRAAVSRLSRELKAPTNDATLLLPIGAAFPSIVDASHGRASGDADLDPDEVVRFRLAPLLPFPAAQAEIRTEPALVKGGSVLAQAMPKAMIAEGEGVMGSLGFPAVRVTSALSAALRGLSPRRLAVDLVFGDSACAMAVRDGEGAIEALHLRLLLEGEDRGRRSVDEALRATPGLREIRVIGEPAASLRPLASDIEVHPAFDATSWPESADPQRFPFLAALNQGRQS